MNARLPLISGSVAVIFVITLTGCSAPSETPQVASADRPSAAASSAMTAPSTPAKETDYDKALRYTRCMTENGEPMPDPVEGKPLPITNKLPDPKKRGDYEVFDPTTFNKCKQFLPATWPVKWDPEFIAKYRPFNECMRKLGMDVPEPDANGMVRDRTDPMAPRPPEYRAAEDKCRHLIPD